MAELIDILNGELWDDNDRDEEGFPHLTRLRKIPGQAPYQNGPLAGNNPDQGGFDAKGGVDKNREQTIVYSSYAGTDIIAQFVLPNEGAITLGELQTLSYSMHRENTPVRFLGHVSPSGFVKGPRTIAGSLIFTVFNYYAWYRISQFKSAINSGIYPLADMLPPFDIVVTFSNESGALSKMKLYGVTIVDEGQTMSVDDLITEQTYSFMARGIQPMTAHTINNIGSTTQRVRTITPAPPMRFNF